MKKEYNENTQTLIGTQKRELIDKETGEVIWVDQITKRTYGTKQFWKCYLMDFLSILGIIDSKQLDIFIYIAENTNQSTNQFIGTIRNIAQATGTGISTVQRITKKLQENGFIKRHQNGVYMVNPNVLMKGNDHKRQILLNYYQEDDISNTTISLQRGLHPEIRTNSPENKAVEIQGQTSLIAIESEEKEDDK